MRYSISTERLQALIAAVAPLVLEFGSVHRLCEELNLVLQREGVDSRIYPNRLHTLLSEDPGRALNESTVSLVEKSAAGLQNRAALPSGEAESTRARIVRAWRATHGSGSLPELAGNLGFPPAVVRHVLEEAGEISGRSSPEPPKPDLTSQTAARTEPDWSFQDDATRRCLEELNKTPSRKVGLVLPTAGGKTRTALRIALDFARQHPQGKVSWLTHRRDLRDQAQAELQELLSADVKGDEAQQDLKIFAERMEFLMLSELEPRLADEAAPPALLIVDEAHHAAAASYSPIFDTPYPLPALFLTATPNRTDDLPIGIDVIAYSTTYRELSQRGVVLIPEFIPFPVENFDWSEESLADLADHLIVESRDRYTKTIVLAPRIDKAEALYKALRERRLREEFHPLAIDDIGFVHSNRNSLETSTREFLNTFRPKARAIYVATQILLEGFNDRRVNTVFITYPTESMVQLMQAAGRCMRYEENKRRAYVVQAQNERLAYYFDHRWLYQEISDYLRPQLLDVTYVSRPDLQTKVLSILENHRVPEDLRSAVLDAVSRIRPGDRVRVMLSGTPYFGDVNRFDDEAVWTAIPETAANSEEFRWIFNDFSARGALESDPSRFVEMYGKRFGFTIDHKPGSKWRMYTDLLLSQYRAQAEINRKVQASHRPFHTHGATTWLKYVSFEYRPQIPPALDEFLANCHNRDVVTARFEQSPESFAQVLKVMLPLGQYEAWLLTKEGSERVEELLGQIRVYLSGAPPADQPGLFEAILQPLVGLENLPVYVLRRLEQLLPPESYAQRTLRLHKES